MLTLKPGAKIRVKLKKWYAEERGLPSRVLEGTVTAHQGEAVALDGTIATHRHEKCHRCGRAISHPVSLLVGYGPDCSAMLGIRRDFDEAAVEEVRSQLRTLHAFRGLELHLHGVAELYLLEGERETRLALGTSADHYGKAPVKAVRQAALSAVNGTLRAEFVYSPEAVAAIKALPKRTYDGNRGWLLPLSDSYALAAYEALTRLEYAVECDEAVQGLLDGILCEPERVEKARAYINALIEERVFAETRATVTVEREGSGFIARVKAPFKCSEALRAISGRVWNRELKVWEYPNLSRRTVDALRVALQGLQVTWKGLGEAEVAWVAEARLQAAKEAADLPDAPNLKTALWLHQKRSYHFVKGLFEAGKTGAYLALAMGAGKTLTTIALIAGLGFRRVLVAAPRAVVANWGRELAKHSAVEFEVLTLNQDAGTVAEKAEAAQAAWDRAELRGVPLLVAVNYESLVRDPLLSWAQGRRWDLLVADEAHKLKNPEGQRSEAMYKLAQQAKRRLALSGTPMPHSPLDVWAQFRLLDEGVFGKSFYAFRSRYAVLGGYGGKEVVGYRNIEELYEKFYSLAIRVSKEEALDLPERQDITLTFRLSPKAQAAYRELHREMEAYLGSGKCTVNNVLTRILRLQQLTSGYLPIDGTDRLEQLDSGKEELLEELLESLGDEPVVVFCRFQSDLDAVHRVGERLGKRVAELSGRRDQWIAFQEGHYDLIAVQLQAGGAGVELTRARYGVYYSNSFSLGDYDQSRDRIHRPGQTRAVTYYHLVAEGTIDQDIYAALDSRRDLVAGILGGARLAEAA